MIHETPAANGFGGGELDWTVTGPRLASPRASRCNDWVCTRTRVLHGAEWTQSVRLSVPWRSLPEESTRAVPRPSSQW